MAVLVRPATEADLAGIAQTYLESWRGGYAGLLPASDIEVQVEARREHDWRSAIVSTASQVHVALADGKVSGVVQATELSDPERDLPEVTMLYVHPNQWGQGVATALLEAATLWIAERGHRSARLRVVESQARARRFYEREGWHLDGQMPAAHNGYYRLVYYRRDNLIVVQQRP